MTLTLAAGQSEAARARELAGARRRATALLAVVAALFVVITVGGGDATWAGYVQAAAEASLVGGLADWFAVTALFRHPLGIPVPHTAVVRARKDQFGATLGQFVQDSLLTPDSVVARLAGAQVAGRVAAWLAQPDHAERVAGHVADGLVAGAGLVRDEDLRHLAEDVVRTRLASVPLAPVAGRALRLVTEGGRHDELLDAAIAGLDRWLDEHRDELRDRFGQRSPWWLPGAVEHRVFERLLDGVRSLLREMAGDPDHDLRRHLDNRLAGLAEELETSPELRRKGEELKRDLLDHPLVREWAASLWDDLKPQLQAQAADPSSELRRRLTAAVVAAGQRLLDDPILTARLQDSIEAGARYVVEHFAGEIAGLVQGTIERWDGDETSRRLELLLGPDLQYIRISGTVVGGAAGLGLHTVAQALG
jgi:uncharacterized membrane-anchored protein YjiN (DUF445 family)